MLAFNITEGPSSYQSLVPAGAGTPRYENGVDWWQRVPAIHAISATLWIPAFAGMDESVDGSPFSYQSFMPAGAGTPRDEKAKLRLGTENQWRRFCLSPPRAQRGTSPRTTLTARE